MATAKRKPRRAELDVTLDEYERLLAAQGGGCALCANPPRTRRLDVDHDHRTGLVRGLLCSRCNSAIPSERYMPAGWTLPEWAASVNAYAGRWLPSDTERGNDLIWRMTLDEINSRRKDGGS